MGAALLNDDTLSSDGVSDVVARPSASPAVFATAHLAKIDNSLPYGLTIAIESSADGESAWSTEHEFVFGLAATPSVVTLDSPPAFLRASWAVIGGVWTGVRVYVRGGCT
jgi:hypothetical protein